jgi:hypothetical protein
MKEVRDLVGEPPSAGLDDDEVIGSRSAYGSFG